MTHRSHGAASTLNEVVPHWIWYDVFVSTSFIPARPHDSVQLVPTSHASLLQLQDWCFAQTSPGSPLTSPVQVGRPTVAANDPVTPKISTPFLMFPAVRSVSPAQYPEPSWYPWVIVVLDVVGVMVCVPTLVIVPVSPDPEPFENVAPAKT